MHTEDLECIFRFAKEVECHTVKFKAQKAYLQKTIANKQENMKAQEEAVKPASELKESAEEKNQEIIEHQAQIKEVDDAAAR